LLEITGNSLLKGVLLRIKQRLMSQLLQDYQQWAKQDIIAQNYPETILDLSLS
jgi:hypothetical protein